MMHKFDVCTSSNLKVNMAKDWKKLSQYVLNFLGWLFDTKAY